MFKKILGAFALLGLSFGLSTYSVNSLASSSGASTKATATLASACTISAQNLSFGALTLPLSAQTASTSMSVLCSKSHAYTIGLAYGGVYGVGANPVQHVYININGTVDEQQSGGGFSPCNCTIPANSVNEGPVWNGLNYTGYSNIYVAQVPTTFYTYGKMLGAAKGDSVGYFIQVPNNPGQVWNTGNYTYSSTGTGASQTIPVVGTLVPAQSGSKYPTPDAYSDTVTAVVNF